MNIRSLRISLTQRCNLTCPYCHHEGDERKGEEPSGEMDLATIRAITEAAHSLGIKRFKLTGGEPLMRQDILDIVRMMKEKGAEDISMTTNGTLLASKAEALREAGLDRVNVGCDSISCHILEKTATSVADGIAAAKCAGMGPIKINMVVLKGINHHEIPDMMTFAKEQGAILQLIELIDMDHAYFKKYHYPLREVEESLRKQAKNIIVRPEHNRKQYDLGDVIVETVRPMHKDFCQACKRLRITSDGEVKPCLMRSDNHIPFCGIESLQDAIRMKEAYYD